MPRKIRVGVEQRLVKRIHNDLGNTAFHLRNRVVQNDANGKDGGILLDIMAALTMTAFWLEACLNFIGVNKIENWDERAPFNKKTQRLFDHCKIQADMNIRPFVSIVKLKKFRDTLAHGKPETLIYESEEIRELGDVRQPGLLEADWEKMRRVESVEECYEDVNTIWLQMLAAVGMTELEASSHGSRGLTYRGDIEDDT